MPTSVAVLRSNSCNSSASARDSTVACAPVSIRKSYGPWPWIVTGTVMRSYRSRSISITSSCGSGGGGAAADVLASVAVKTAAAAIGCQIMRLSPRRDWRGAWAGYHERPVAPRLALLRRLELRRGLPARQQADHFFQRLARHEVEQSHVGRPSEHDGHRQSLPARDRGKGELGEAHDRRHDRAEREAGGQCPGHAARRKPERGARLDKGCERHEREGQHPGP